MDPEFFTALPGRLRGVTAAALELKRGWHHNELTRFRYDAWLEVNGPTRTPAQPAVDCHWQEVRSIELLRERLAVGQPGLLCVRGVPNARLLTEQALLRWLEQAGAEEHLGQLSMDLSGVEPEFCWALARDSGHRIQLNWSDAAERYDIFCTRDLENNSPLWGVLCDPAAHALPWSAYGNRPAAAAPGLERTESLKTFLRLRLPEYMVPAAFVSMDALPLTPNGKLNRRALPPPDAAARRPDDVYAPPETDLQRKITEIWSQLLAIDRIGIDANFFNIGGHSLLATQVVSRLSDALGREIPLRWIFEKPTVRRLAEIFESSEAGAPVVPPVTPRQEPDWSGIDADKLTDAEVDTLLLTLLENNNTS